MKPLLTFRATAARVPIPKTTFARKIRELGIMPDAITVEIGNRPSVMLFAPERLAEIRRLINPQEA